MKREDILPYLVNLKITDKTLEVLEKYEESKNISLIINYLISNDRFNIDLLNLLTKNLTDSKMIKNFIDEKNLEEIVLKSLKDDSSLLTKENMCNFYNTLLFSDKVNLNDRMFLLSTLETFIFNQRKVRSFISIPKEDSKKLQNLGLYIYKNLINYFIENKNKVTLVDLPIISFIFTNTRYRKDYQDLNENENIDQDLINIDVLKNELKNENFIKDIFDLNKELKNKINEKNNDKVNTMLLKNKNFIDNILQKDLFIFLIKNNEELSNYFDNGCVNIAFLKLFNSNKDLILKDEYCEYFFNCSAEQFKELLEPMDNPYYFASSQLKKGKTITVKNESLNPKYYYVQMKGRDKSLIIKLFLDCSEFYNTTFGKNYLNFIEKDINELIDYVNESSEKEITLPKDIQKISHNSESYFSKDLTSFISDGSTIYDRLSNETKNKIFDFFVKIKTKRIVVDIKCSSLEGLNDGYGYNKNVRVSLGNETYKTLENLMFQKVSVEKIIELKKLYNDVEIEKLIIRKFSLETKFKELNLIKEYAETYDKYLTDKIKICLMVKYFDVNRDIDFSFTDVYNKELINNNLKTNEENLFFMMDYLGDIEYLKFFKLIDIKLFEKIIENNLEKTKNNLSIIRYLLKYSDNTNLILILLKCLTDLDIKNKIIASFEYSKWSSNNDDDKDKIIALEKMKTLDIYKNGTKLQLEYIKNIEETLSKYKNEVLLSYNNVPKNSIEKEEVKEKITSIILDFLK